MGRFLREDGSPVDSSRVIVDTPESEFSPRLAAAPEGFGLVWLAHGAQGRELRRAWVDRDGIAHPRLGVPVAPPENHPADPAVCTEGETFCVVWRRPLPEDDDDLYMIQVPVRDTLLVPPPVPLIVCSTVGVRHDRKPSGLRAVPNPFSTRVWIERPEGDRDPHLEIYDARGRLVRRVGEGAGGGWWWDGRGSTGVLLPAGLYLARAGRGGGSVRLIRLP
jgi:hypothetical protein